jgi:hypothetical protein
MYSRWLGERSTTTNLGPGGKARGSVELALHSALRQDLGNKIAATERAPSSILGAVNDPQVQPLVRLHSPRRLATHGPCLRKICAT